VTSINRRQNDTDLEPPLDITRPFMDDNRLSISGGTRGHDQQDRHGAPPAQNSHMIRGQSSVGRINRASWRAIFPAYVSLAATGDRVRLIGVHIGRTRLE
jgi:hypothetical protein